jgi:hypothetical protein
MEQEVIMNEEGKVEEVKQKPAFKKKRDIFRFQGEKDISINLEHVTTMFAEGKRITFQFYTNATFIDLEDDAAAKRAYEQIIGVWSADAIE